MTGEFTFEHGQLIVPNEDVAAAFKFDAQNTELIDGMSYRIATYSETVWWNKYRPLTNVPGGIETYRRSVQGEVNSAYASIEKAKKNERKNMQS